MLRGERNLKIRHLYHPWYTKISFLDEEASNILIVFNYTLMIMENKTIRENENSDELDQSWSDPTNYHLSYDIK